MSSLSDSLNRLRDALYECGAFDSQEVKDAFNAASLTASGIERRNTMLERILDDERDRLVACMQDRDGGIASIERLVRDRIDVHVSMLFTEREEGGEES